MRAPRTSIAPFISKLIVVLFFLPFVMVLFLFFRGNALGQSSDTSSSEGEALTTPPTSFVFDYTGALFGYFRIEPGSPIGTLAPVPEFFHQRLPRDTAEGTAADLLGRLALTPQDRSLLVQAPLLVGMGDNFGPEFGAALQMNEFKNEPGCHKDYKTTGPPISLDLPQAAYKSEARVLDQQPVYCDNVTRFLMAAGYRAVVPGREDFLYSATWLRSIALGLRRASDAKPNSPFLIGNSEGRLAMLAANLRVIGTSKDKES